MSNDISRCGLDCGECHCRTSEGCKGCYESNGYMFWGECDVAQCCKNRNLAHCGQCPRFCCDRLFEFAYGSQGDNGRRLERLNQRLKNNS